MELSKPYDHPSLLLVNEIEILFAQIRLMGLYVTQAEATAGKNTARLRERFQADLTALELTLAQVQEAANAATGIQETLQRELLALQTILEQKDLALQQHHAPSGELQDHLNSQLVDLQNQLTEKQVVLEARNQEIGELTGKTNELQNQLTEKEGLAEKHCQEIGELTARTSDLQQQITRLELTNKQAVKEARAAARALEESLGSRSRELEAAVSEKSQLLQNLTAELEASQSETSALRQQMLQIGLTSTQIEAAKTDADRLLAALQTELNGAHKALEQKDRALEQLETEFKGSNSRFNSELLALQTKLAETKQLLEVREETLDHARTRIAGLEEQAARLDSDVATEVEQVRQQSQSELGALREEQETLHHQQTVAAEREAKLESQNQDLHNQLSEKQSLLERRYTEFEQLGLEAGFLQNRIAELESLAHEAEKLAGAEADRIHAEFQAALARVQAQLTEKEQSLAENQDFIRESEARWQSQIQDLQIQLTEKQLLCEARNVEILSLQDRLSVISNQLATLESANQQAAATAARNAALERQQFEAELAGREKELENMARLLADRETQSHDLQRGINTQLSDLQNQLTERQRLLEARNQENSKLAAKANDLQGQLDENHGLLEARDQEISQLTARTEHLQEEIAHLQQANNQTVQETQAAARVLEDSLNSSLRDLEATVSEKSQLLQQLTGELKTAHSETAVLRQRIQQLELIGAQIEADKSDSDRIRASLQSELENAHRVLEQKTTFFAQRETEFTESNERLNAQLQILHNQLVEERGALEDQKREFRTARSEITVLQSRIEELESSEEVAEKNTHIEMEHLKETYQLELAGLRAEIDKQQLALEERQTTIQALQKEHKDERQRLEAQVAEQRSLADRSDAECRENRLAIAALREEMARTEFALRQTEMLATAQAEQLREQFKSEVAALEAQLMAKEETLKAVTEQARELESTNSAKIEELHKEHSEKQSLIKSRNAEMSELRSQITDLLEKIGDLERANREGLEKHRIATTDLEQSLRLQINELQNQLADNQGVLAARNDKIQQLQSQVSQAGLVVKQAETKAADAIEKIRRESESQMESLQAKIHGKLEDIQRREASVCSTEQSFQAEINALRSEVAEKHSLLENRNDELLRVKTETDGLQERIVYLESVASEAELETPDKSDTSDQAEFERLWNELGETEQVLEQLRAAVNDAGSDVHAAPIINLDSELVDKDAMPENLGNGFPRGDSKLTGTQKEKLIRLGELVETIKADNEQTLSPRNRRWRFSLSGRKRRWKS